MKYYKPTTSYNKMAHISWLYNGDSYEFEGDDEVIQARQQQPYFMLKCSKIKDASFIEEISKKDISDLTTDGYLYSVEKIPKYFILDQHCVYLLGVFNIEKKRIFQESFDLIKEKAKIWKENYKEYTKTDTCVLYQKNILSLLSQNTDEYNKSSELLTYFKKKVEELKILNQELEKEIESLIIEYVFQELKLLFAETSGINIQGTIKNYINFFIVKN